MKKLYLVESYEVGEVQGVFTEGGSLIAAWCLNDANWRSEYFSDLLEHLGAKMVSSDDPELVEKLESLYR